MSGEAIYSSAPELQRPRAFLAAALRDLGRSPAIAWPLFRTNVQARLRRTWLGYVWLLLPTVAMTAVWVYAQSRRVVTIAPTELPYALHVLSGMVLWQLFVDTINAPHQQLAAGRQLITRSRVPHEALILAGVLEALLNCAVRLTVLAVVLAAFRVPLAATALLVPAGIAALVLLGLACGVLVAPFALLSDDVSRAIALVTGFWFFATPVIYPTPGEGLLRLNPVTPLLDTTRAWLTSGRVAGGFVTVTAAAALLLTAAWLLQRLARPHVVARLG